jgi:hypothetical protein
MEVFREVFLFLLPGQSGESLFYHHLRIFVATLSEVVLFINNLQSIQFLVPLCENGATEAVQSITSAKKGTQLTNYLGVEG